MKKIVLIITAILISFASQAQGIYNSNARIVSESGSSWVISGGTITLTSENATYPTSVSNLKIESGATLSLASASYLTVGGALHNSGTLAGNASSTVKFSDPSSQAITGTGTTTFGNLTIDNNGGLTLTNAGITVNGILDFQNGILTSGTNTATIGASGSITNAGSSKYVNGKLAQTYSSTGSKVFPIGKGGNYRPLSFNYTAVTGTSVVTAEQTETGMTGTMPANATLLTSGRYWTVTQSGGTDLQYFVTLDGTDYTASNTVVLLQKDAGTIFSRATTTPNYTNASALTSLSDFALGQLNYLNYDRPAPTLNDLIVKAPAGAVIKWYDAETGGTLLDGSTQLTNATNYWASQTVNGCESPVRFKETAIVGDCYISVTTTAVSSISTSGATSGGTISNICGGAVTASGVCWSTSPGPLATGSHTAGVTAFDSFTSSVSELSSGITYYVRAYLTTSSGTAYGNEVSFTTP
ncbi:MAG: hypothetical protein WCO63_13580 [Bacteroidota bacterium]